MKRLTIPYGKQEIIKRPITANPLIRKTIGNWARYNKQKVRLFAEHLVQIFSHQLKTMRIIFC